MIGDITTTQDRIEPPGSAPRSAAERIRAYLELRHRWALALILLLAAACNFYALQREGFANLYYAAAVRSMLESWHNFFFVSFDPGGFVTVDKPPLGFWIQAASARIFGYSGFSILLPEALAGIASVGVLYVLVRRLFGPAAGLLAALFLAITPISVVTNRNNTIDSLLVLTVLLAAYAASRAIETGRLSWLLLCAVLVGLGFNIKMLEAYLVVPALAVVYLLGAPLGWWKRIWHLAVAGVVMAALSLSWVLAVDLTPAADRPYVGSSGSNSELALALGYNGIQRLLGNLFRIPAQVANATASVATNGPGGPGGASENGAIGFFRLLNAQLGGQASWLLALGIVGLLASGWGFHPRGYLRTLPGRMGTWVHVAAARRGAHLTPQQAALVLWGLWTLTMAVFFSIAGFFHRYYLSMLAPGVAALAGIGVVLLWRDYRASRDDPALGRWDWRSWLLPVALMVTALTQAVILADYSGWNAWMTPLIVGGSLLAAGVLVWYRLQNRPAVESIYAPAPATLNWGGSESVELTVDSAAPNVEAPGRRRLPRWTYGPLVAASLGVALLLVGPATWTAYSLADGGGGTLPAAGPTTTLAQTGGFSPGRFSGGFRTFPGGFPAGAPAGAFPGGGFPGGGGFGGAGGRGLTNGSANNGQGLQVNSALLSYLEAHQGSAQYLFATLSSQTAAPYIIETGKPVMALGGFSGSDQILTLSQLETLIRDGQVKYFLLDGGGFGGPGGGSSNSQLVQWVEAHGTLISVDGTQLYYVSSAAAS